jgi:hypothetical protein
MITEICMGNKLFRKSEIKKIKIPSNFYFWLNTKQQEVNLNIAKNNVQLSFTIKNNQNFIVRLLEPSVNSCV